MNEIQLDLLNRFDASDASSTENVSGDSTEKQIAKKMDANLHGGKGAAPFEPRPVDADLQDQINSRKRKNPGQYSSSLEKEEGRSNWYSILDRTLAIGRLMLEDIYENDGSKQILLLVSSLSPLYQKIPNDFFKKCLANDYEFSLSRRGVAFYQVPCTIETKGSDLHGCKDTESVLGRLENVEWCDLKTITIRICGMKSLHSISVNDVLKDTVSLFGIHKETVFDKNFWDFLKKYRCFETARSMLLQVAGEVSGDPYASERLRAAFWRMNSNFGDVKNKRDKASAISGLLKLGRHVH
jgi:hypothetical protein